MSITRRHLVLRKLWEQLAEAVGCSFIEHSGWTRLQYDNVRRKQLAELLGTAAEK